MVWSSVRGVRPGTHATDGDSGRDHRPPRPVERSNMNVRRMTLAAASALVGLLAFAVPALAGADIERERTVIELAGEVEWACSEPILLTDGQAVEMLQVFTDANGREHFL